ncbi:prosaposin-like [Littorina saxatilis]|uniref:Pulmonary surfactant-associated protein B n=1 Tax=Littorina saxatilis TaxID=31220 RepID=A0AAN9BW56_9CAEN
MKILLLFAFAAIGQCALLGSKKCTYGPSYWCSHIHHAKECNALQHCITTVWKNQDSAMTGSTETCFDVIQVLDVVRKSSDSDLLGKMAVGCTGMPAEKRATCKELMTHDQKEVHQLLSSDLPSARIASALGLCGAYEDAVSHPVEVSKDYCTDCTNFFGDIREIFNNSEGQAVAMLKKLVCTKVGPLQDLCNQLVDQYASMVFQLVYQQLNPRDICLILQLCANQTHADIINNLEQIMAKRQKSSVGCDVCQNIAKDVQSALRDATFQKDIMTAVEDKVCPLFPGDLGTQCKSYVSEYGPVVFQILVAELDPKTICQTIGVCNATKTDKKLTAVPLSSPMGTVHILPAQLAKVKVAASPQCALCEFVMSKLESMLTTNATEEQIEAALKQVCNLLPKSIADECDSFVTEYGPMVINLLLHEVGPQAVCTALGLCVGDKPKIEKPLPVKSGETCLICETVLGYVKSALNDPNNEKTIEQLLDEVCDIVPASYKGMCDQLVTAYTPAIINLLAQYDDPVQVCTGLGLCTKTINNETKLPSQPLKFKPMLDLQAAKPHLLGSEKCTYGPSFWCASVENAKQCNALEHCAKYYNLKMDTAA